MVFLETPTNPVMIVTDLKEVSEIAHRAGARVVCDNTFMSPYLQRPLEFGSTSSCTRHEVSQRPFGRRRRRRGSERREDANWIGFVQNSAGAILSPFDSWLVMRGTKTLALRMDSTTNRAARSPRFSKSTRRCEKGLLSRLGVAPAARAGAPAATRFRRHGGV
jgi:cystathionine beta-lyase/cystathionine gamma-synthase